MRCQSLPFAVMVARCLALGPTVAARAQVGTAVSRWPGTRGHLNPAISTSGPLHAVAGSLFIGLGSLNDAGNPEPDLAQSWAVAADGLSVTFHLRPELRWHDGQPFTATDVKTSFEQVLLHHHARARSSTISHQHRGLSI